MREEVVQLRCLRGRKRVALDPLTSVYLYRFVYVLRNRGTEIDSRLGRRLWPKVRHARVHCRLISPNVWHGLRNILDGHRLQKRVRIDILRHSRCCHHFATRTDTSFGVVGVERDTYLVVAFEGTSALVITASDAQQASTKSRYPHLPELPTSRNWLENGFSGGALARHGEQATGAWLFSAAFGGAHGSVSCSFDRSPDALTRTLLTACRIWSSIPSATIVLIYRRLLWLVRSLRGNRPCLKISLVVIFCLEAAVS